MKNASRQRLQVKSAAVWLPPAQPQPQSQPQPQPQQPEQAKLPKRPPRPELSLSLQFADPRHRAWLARHQVARWLRAALGGPAQMTVRIVDAAEGQTLNRDYRGKDYATNVLTFDYERQPQVVADLVLCAPVVEREAAEQGIDLAAHYAHLLVHGALHALGHDHEQDAPAQVMEALESAILLKLGFADPYARGADVDGDAGVDADEDASAPESAGPTPRRKAKTAKAATQKPAPA